MLMIVKNYGGGIYGSDGIIKMKVAMKVTTVMMTLMATLYNGNDHG